MQSDPSRSTGTQSSQNQGQHSENCTKALFLDAIDKTSLVYKENHQTPGPSGCKMHCCSSNGCIQLKMQTDHSQNCSIEQAFT